MSDERHPEKTQPEAQHQDRDQDHAKDPAQSEAATTEPAPETVPDAAAAPEPPTVPEPATAPEPPAAADLAPTPGPATAPDPVAPPEPSFDEDEEEEERRANAASAEFGKMLDEFSEGHAQTDPEVGEKVTGHIVMIDEGSGFVDFGGRSEGVVDIRHLSDEKGKVTYQVGDTIELFVTANDDQVTLSPNMELRPEMALSQILDAKRAGLPIAGKVSGLNAGGLDIKVAGLRGFCPFSQIELGYCSEPSVYLGKTLEFLVTQIEGKGKNIVLSRKDLLRRDEAEKARELIEKIGEGIELDGTVTRLQPFGAFVDLGGIEGLLHVSEIRYGRTEHPGDVLSEGETVRVKVLGVDRSKGDRPRISLSIKAAQPDPWEEVNDTYWAGRKLTGLVTRLAKFGAFVQLSPGIEGLVHISEISRTPIKDPSDVLSPGQSVEISVLNVDAEKRRISLSIRDIVAGQSGTGDSKSLERAPAVKDLADGFVAGIKQFGIFVDLPAYGHRARGLVPHEETGEKPGTDLAKRFQIADPLKVEIIAIADDGKIRLSMIRVRDREEQDKFQAFKAKATNGKGGNTAMEEAFRKAQEKGKD